MIQLMRTMLGQQMAKGKMSQSQYKDIMKDAQESVQDKIKQAQDEKEQEENVSKIVLCLIFIFIYGGPSPRYSGK